MKNYEYEIIKFDLRGGIFSSGGKVDTEILQKKLTELGDKGWELVNSIDTAQYHGSSRDLVMIFKREKE